MIETGNSFLIRAMRICFYFIFKLFKILFLKLVIPKINLVYFNPVLPLDFFILGESYV